MRIKLLVLIAATFILGFLVSGIYGNPESNFVFGVSDYYYYYFSIPIHYLMLMFVLSGNLLGRFKDLILICLIPILFCVYKYLINNVIDTASLKNIILSGMITGIFVYFLHNKILINSKKNYKYLVINK